MYEDFAKIFTANSLNFKKKKTVGTIKKTRRIANKTCLDDFLIAQKTNSILFGVFLHNLRMEECKTMYHYVTNALTSLTISKKLTSNT